MARQNSHMRPTSRKLAPDPADCYERADPNHESGMGRLDNNPFTPAESPDRIDQAVNQKQPLRQLNADDVIDAREEGQVDGQRMRSEVPRADGSKIETE